MHAPCAGQPKVQLRAHPSSVLWRVSTPWVVFYQAQQGESGWYDMQARPPCYLLQRRANAGCDSDQVPSVASSEVQHAVVIPCLCYSA